MGRYLRPAMTLLTSRGYAGARDGVGGGSARLLASVSAAAVLTTRRRAVMTLPRLACTSTPSSPAHQRQIVRSSAVIR